MKLFIKFLFMITFIVFTTSSCISDFFEEEKIEQKQQKKKYSPPKEKIDSNKVKSSEEKPNKTKSQGDYYRESTKQTKQQTKPVPTPSTNNTLEKEKIKEKYEKILEKQQKQIQELAKRNNELANQTTSKLIKSTYDVKYKESVEEILYYMYVAYLKRKNVSEATLSEAFKKTFTIDYCDDRVLETLDNIVAKNNKWLGRSSYYINYKDIANPDKTGNELVKKRK